MKKYILMGVNALLTVIIIIISMYINYLIQGNGNNILLFVIIFIVVYVVVFLGAIILYTIVKNIFD